MGNLPIQLKQMWQQQTYYGRPIYPERHKEVRRCEKTILMAPLYLSNTNILSISTRP